MRSLVWRYVAAQHRKFEDNPVTEDDINEVKSEISTMRYEMLEIFENSGMDVTSAAKKEKRKWWQLDIRILPVIMILNDKCSSVLKIYYIFIPSL